MRYVCTEDNDDVMELLSLNKKFIFTIKDELYDEEMDVFLSKEDVKRLIDDLKTCLESMGD